MKTRKLVIGFFYLSTILIGCQDDSSKADEFLLPHQTNKVLYQKDAKLKRILVCESNNYENITSIEAEYEYDALGRINNVSCPIYEDDRIIGFYSYDLYEYNAENQLHKISNYHSNSHTGFVNLQNSIFTYDLIGNKIQEQIEYPQVNRSELFLYCYDYRTLTMKEKYYRDQLDSYTKYEYNSNGEIVKEVYYTAAGHEISITKHTYVDNINIKTEFFNGGNMEKIWELDRIYDKNGNLIFVDFKVLSILSSMMSHGLKYEYDN